MTAKSPTSVCFTWSILYSSYRMSVDAHFGQR